MMSLLRNQSQGETEMNMHTFIGAAIGFSLGMTIVLMFGFKSLDNRVDSLEDTMSAWKSSIESTQ